MGEGAGTVAHWDDHGGFGLIRADDGRELFFHCTAIASGERTIEEGARVAFEVVPGQLGRWEADGVRRRELG